jgi:hypothetical protein
MPGLRTAPSQAARRRCPSPRRGRGAAARRVAVDLTPEAVDKIAIRVAALLRGGSTKQAPELISAGELARRLRVERPWVYRHRELLGGMRIGVGPKAPWRFEYETAVEALRRLQTEQSGEGGRRLKVSHIGLTRKEER